MRFIVLNIISVIAFFSHSIFSAITPANLKDEISSVKTNATHEELLTEGYHTQKEVLLVGTDLIETWNKYKNATPGTVWSGPHVLYQYGKDQNDGDVKSTDVMQENMRLVIKIIFGKIKLDVGLIVNQIDDGKKLIQISYVKSNRSQGTQYLTFKQVGDKTEITHMSYFKSESKLRDVLLYKYFHKRTVREFHSKVR
jgi:hypothetical protein